MKRSAIVIGVVILFTLFIFRLPFLRAVNAAYDGTIQIVNSSGTVLDGVASATTASYDRTVRVVDSTGHVIDSFGGAPSGAAGGDLGGTYPNPTVTGTHLSSPLPAAQGGNGTATYGPALITIADGGVGGALGGSNQLECVGLQTNAPFTISQGLWFDVSTTDGTGLYDIALYYIATPGSGNAQLIADTGAIHLSGSAQVGALGSGASNITEPTLPATEPAGFYAACWTGNSTTGKLFYTSTAATPVWFRNTNVTTTSGGKAPATFAAPAMSVTVPNRLFFGVF